MINESKRNDLSAAQVGDLHQSGPPPQDFDRLETGPETLTTQNDQSAPGPNSWTAAQTPSRRQETIVGSSAV